jgi:hypothetical protein
MQDTNDIKKCKRCPRGGGVASCGQILSKGNKEKPSLQGDSQPFKKHKRLAQWGPKFNIQAFTFVRVVRESIYWSPKKKLPSNYAKN